MKKIILATMMVGMFLASCTKNSKQEAFKYSVDTFYDVEILRYKVPGFEQLSLQQKKLCYYLSEAALSGMDILFDQNGAYNLRIRTALEGLYVNYQGDKKTEEFLALERYLKRVWFSNGIHHHYGADKFLPEFSQEWFVAACEQCGVTYDEAILPVMFDPTVLAKKINQTAGEDLILTSACNYYEGVTQKEAQAYYDAHKDKSAQPLWIGLNSKLVKKDGKVVEETYKVGGLYGEALEKVNFWLEKAKEVAENDQQKTVIQKLIDFNATGDLKTFNEYCIAWVQDLDSRVDFVNGFTETYGDPLGVTAAWESMVNFKDLEATHRAQLIAENAQWFEDNSPTDKRFKKENVTGVSAKVITAVILSGDCYPATPIGINLPNANWIRKEYGSKSVTIDNITDAYNAVANESGFAEEFMLPEIIDAYKKNGTRCSSLHTDLHECAGHGSGKLLDGVSKDALKEYSATIEETRADLFGLYFMADKKMIELGLLETPDDYKSYYYQQMMNGLLTQLVRIEPGKDLEQSHMRNRQLIALWVLKNAKNNEVEVIQQDGNYFVKINDYEGLQKLYGELLATIQRITSEGDYQAAKEIVEEYAVKINPEWHKNILERYAHLNLAPYKGFVNPVYTPVLDKNGEITDIKVDYTEGYVEQHLRYSKDYSFLTQK